MPYITFNGRIRTFSTRVFRHLRTNPVQPPTPEICGIPGEPTATVLSQSSVRISWASVINSQVYELRFRRVGSANWSLRTTINTTIDIGNLPAGTQHEYEIRSLCSETTSPWTSTKTFTTDEEVIQPPTVCGLATNLTASAISHEAAVISWQAGQNAQFYRVRYRVQGAGAWVEQTTGNSSLSLTGLSPETSYEYQVQTQCEGLVSAYTASSIFTTAQEPITGTCVAPTVTYQASGGGIITITAN